MRWNVKNMLSMSSSQKKGKNKKSTKKQIEKGQKGLTVNKSFESSTLIKLIIIIFLYKMFLKIVLNPIPLWFFFMRNLMGHLVCHNVTLVYCNMTLM